MSDQKPTCVGCTAPIQNHYGQPYVVKKKGVPRFGIEAAHGFTPDEVEVSEEFFAAFVKEFGPKGARDGT